MVKQYQKILLVCLVILITSCDAPRENPVDPNNPDNNFSSINGVVKTKGYPFNPIGNVDVFWENDNIIVKTTQNGKYGIPRVTRNNGWLKFHCESYIDDSTYIDWGNSDIISNEIFLNSKPILDSLEFFSVVKNSWNSATKEHYLKIRVRISDFEGVNDIVNVYVENIELYSLKKLSYDYTNNFYEGKLWQSDLGGNSLDGIIGKDFRILVNDLDSSTFIIGNTSIKRVINEEIELISPISNEEVNIPFKLNWKRFTPGFNFTYRVEIYTNETVQNLVYSRGNIEQDSISYTVNSQIDAGSYYWIIWAIDEFNNQGSSKQGSFIINN
ncbi:MAG: hypothetical protein ABFS12_01905 [Bacteroidota bacterium]